MDLDPIEDVKTVLATRREKMREMLLGLFTTAVVVVGLFLFVCVLRWISEWIQ